MPPRIWLAVLFSRVTLPAAFIFAGAILMRGSAVLIAENSITFVKSSESLRIAEPFAETWGISTADWNGDYCDDLYIGRHSAAYPRLYRNPCTGGFIPGAFIDEVKRLRLHRLRWRTTKDRHAPAFGDYDGDGREDLFITTGGGAGRQFNEDQLFHQLPNGNFANVAPRKGMTDPLGSGRIGIWFDYDADGDLDLFLGHFLHTERREENRNILWKNTAGRFANAAAEAGIGTIESSVTGIATDLDHDGDMDLITAPGIKVSLYVNQGDGTFIRSTLGFGQTTSVAPGDFDNDGDLDLFLCRGARNETATSVLLRNDGDSWSDVTDLFGLGYSLCVTAVWADVDNDGNIDLFLTRNVDATGVNQPNMLLINNYNRRFIDVARSAGIQGPTDGSFDSAVWADFNRDGFVDFAVESGDGKSRSPVLAYINRGNSNHWITVRLTDPYSHNRQALGAKVWARAGGQSQYREIRQGIGYQSQSAPTMRISA